MEGNVADGGIAEAPSTGVGQQWGRPAPCPKCGSSGYLEHIDLVDRVMYQKCTNWECRHKWETAEAELADSA